MMPIKFLAYKSIKSIVLWQFHVNTLYLYFEVKDENTLTRTNPQNYPPCATYFSPVNFVLQRLQNTFYLAKIILRYPENQLGS